MNKYFGAFTGSPLDIGIKFLNVPNSIEIADKQYEKRRVPVYSSNSSVTGEVTLTPIPGRQAIHTGVRIQLLGLVEIPQERNVKHEFLSLVRDLLKPGELTEKQVLKFDFHNVEMGYDTYETPNAHCRYIIRVLFTRQYAVNVVQDATFVVKNHHPIVEVNDQLPIKMEVGIDECLHIEFEYSKCRYYLDDIVEGRIYFLLVRIKLKVMELEIKRKETTGTGASAANHQETIARYEIMDGAPVRGESIPIRLFLAPFSLSPTYMDVHNKFSVRYFLNLILVDEEDRRYFKQSEIELFRGVPQIQQ